MGAQWLVEEGIGEHRGALCDGGRIVAAAVDWPGELSPGLVADAVLVARAGGSRRGTARFPGGEEALVDALPREAREGAVLRLEVVRSAIYERRRIKRAHARPSAAPLRPAPTLAERLGATRVPRIAGWDELWGEALSGEIAFAGGTLTFDCAAAMTVVDVDGELAPRVLALAAVPPLAQALRRFAVTGSVAVDFPTLADKGDRQVVDAALAHALADWPHARTAMNGFGLVQLVARRERPSLLERMTRPAAAAVRLLLRRGEGVEAPGALLLTASSPVRAAMRPEWEAELARRTGRVVRWHIDEALAPEGSFAQAVPR